MKNKSILVFLGAWTVGAVCAADRAPCQIPVDARPVNVPALLTTEKGEAVADVAAWENTRRPEIFRTLCREEYGFRPVERPADLRFEAAAPDCAMMDGRAVRKLVRASWRGTCRAGSFEFMAFIPASAKEKPAPAFVLICNRPPARNIDPARKHKSPFWPAEEIVARGYAAIAFWNGDIAPDDNSPVFTNGVYSCFSKNGVRTDESWGALSAWGWGASRVLDWIETEPLLDAKHVGVVGHSRGGKTALWCGASDPRFAMACSNDSGCSGAKLNHVDLPKSESIKIITGAFRHWFCRNYDKWADREMQMPFDQHMLVALMAPRLVAIASATKDHWAGQPGEWWSGKLASPAWELYGLQGLAAERFPAPDAPQQEGCVSYHLRTGGHGLTPYDWKCYLDFADRHGWRK